MAFEQGREHLRSLSEEELQERFWKLANSVVEPLVDLAQTHTSPSIERSVLLRMGFNSIDAKAIVDAIYLQGLLGKGAGHVVYRYAQSEGLSLQQAGHKLVQLENWQKVKALFAGGGGRV